MKKNQSKNINSSESIDKNNKRLKFLDHFKKTISSHRARKSQARSETESEITHYYDSIIACMPNNVYWLDRDCVLQGGNDNLAKLFGLESRTQLKGLTYKKMTKLANWSEGQGEIFRQAEIEVMRTGKPRFNVEEPPIIVNGQTRYYMSSKVPLFNKDKEVIGVVGISTDITDIKKTKNELSVAKEEAEKANILKTQFIENMQHDIRTPASGLWSMLNELSLTITDKDLADTLTMLRDSAKELYNLCNDMVNFNQDQNTETPFINKRINIENIIQQVVDLEKAAVLKKHIDLVYRIDKNVPKIVRGDEFRLKRILINLVGNAVKFTQQGQVTIHLHCPKITDTQIILVFSISDTGIGIPDSKKAFVYEKFSRAVDSNKGLYKGTGLGLYIVKSLVDKLKGEIDFYSTEGKGTKFFVTIPFMRPITENIEPNSTNTNNYVEKHSIKRSKNDIAEPNYNTKIPEYKILLIEDDLIAQLATKQTLKSLNQCVTTANNCENAFNILSSSKFDLIISDIGLPDGTGLEIITKIKSDTQHKNYKTPFIALTAHNDLTKRQEMEDKGFDLIYNKPLLKDMAMNAIQKFTQLDHNFVSSHNTIITSNNEKSIDLEYGQAIMNIDESIAKNMLAIFIDSASELTQQLEKLRELQDLQKLREQLHKLKGGISYVGLPKLQNLVSECYMKLDTTNNFIEIDSEIKTIIEEIDNIKEIYCKLS